MSATTAASAISVLDVLEDRMLLAPAFTPIGSWDAWKSFLRILFGLSLSQADMERFRACTARAGAPVPTYREAWVLSGRRSGKSRMGALVALYLAAFRSYRVAPGEAPVVMLLASDKSQAKVLLGYLEGLLESTPILKELIEARSADSITLTNGVSLEVHANNYRAVRGRTLVACIADEICFWRSDESLNPDAEVISAVRPALATTKGLLIAISSPHSKSGIAYSQYRKYYGKDDPRVLVWQSDSLSMNPSLDPQVVADAYEEDPAVAASEFGGQWRNDLEGYVTREIVEACVVSGVHECGWISSNSYQAFVDVSGGSRDSSVVAIGHSEKRDGRDIAVIDCVRERQAPFDPEDVTREFAELLKSYRVSRLVGDRYGGEWPSSAFARYGIQYEAAEKTRSQLYQEFLPAVRARAVELPDVKKMIVQLCQLERRVSRGGAETIDHGVGAHDDTANAVAGCAYILKNMRNTFRCWTPGGADSGEPIRDRPLTKQEIKNDVLSSLKSKPISEYLNRF